MTVWGDVSLSPIANRGHKHKCVLQTSYPPPNPYLYFPSRSSLLFYCFLHENAHDRVKTFRDDTHIYHGEVLWNIHADCLKLVRTPLNVYFTAFKSIFLSLSMHLLPRMNVMLDFIWTLPVQLRGTRNKWTLQKILVHGRIRTTNSAPLVFQRVPLTTRLQGQLTIWD